MIFPSYANSPRLVHGIIKFIAFLDIYKTDPGLAQYYRLSNHFVEINAVYIQGLLC